MTSVFAPKHGVILLAVLLACISGCAEPTREEIIERYPGGEKRIVAVYRGEGSNEILIERKTYLENGTLTKLENLSDGTVKGYVELNPTLNLAAGLKKALQGTWYMISLENSGEHTEQISRATVTFRGDTIEVQSEGRYTQFGDGWSSNIESEFEYLANRRGRDVRDKSDTEQALEAPPYPIPEQQNYYRFDFQPDGALDVTAVQIFDDIAKTVRPVWRLYRDENIAEANSLETGAILDEGDNDFMDQMHALGSNTELAQKYPEWHKEVFGEETQPE